MKPKEQLPSKYKAALKGYSVPPREEQWQRIALVMSHSRKRRIFWFWMLGLFLVSGLSAITWWAVGNRQQAHAGSEKTISRKTEVRTPAERKETVSAPEKDPLQTLANASGSTSSKRQNPDALPEMPHVQNGNTGNPAVPAMPPTELQPAVPPATDDRPLDFIGFSLGKKGSGPLPAEVWIYEPFEQLVYPTKEPTKPKGKADRGLFVTAGVSAGNVQNPITSIENSPKQHKDVAGIYEQLFGNFQSNAIQLGLEYRPARGPKLSISGGIQYRQLHKEVDFTYTIDELPLRDFDGTIIGYVRDTFLSGIPLRYSNRNTLSFIDIPLYLRYPLWSDARNEISVGAGVQVQALVGVNGEYLDINELRLSKLNPQSFDGINLGYRFGIGYSRHIWKRVSLFADAQYMTNTQALKTGFGNIESRMQGTSVQFGIRTKISRK